MKKTTIITTTNRRDELAKLYKKLSKNDQKYVRAAMLLHYIDWPLVDDFILLTESELAKSELKKIKNTLFHMEETACGLS